MRTIDFISTEPSLFHSLVTLGPHDLEVVLCALHAPSSSTARPQFWQCLAQDPHPSQRPWMVLGDLNTVTNKTEKNGGRPFRLSECHALMDFVNFSSLVNLGFSGTMYTWENGRLGTDRI